MIELEVIHSTASMSSLKFAEIISILLKRKLTTSGLTDKNKTPEPAPQQTATQSMFAKKKTSRSNTTSIEFQGHLCVAPLHSRLRLMGSLGCYGNALASSSSNPPHGGGSSTIYSTRELSHKWLQSAAAPRHDHQVRSSLSLFLLQRLLQHSSLHLDSIQCISLNSRRLPKRLFTKSTKV